MTATQEETDALDIARLVGRAAHGERWAWARLVEQYERLIRVVTGDPGLRDSDATDVAQVNSLRLLVRAAFDGWPLA